MTNPIVTETNQNEIDKIVGALLKKEQGILEIRLFPDNLSTIFPRKINRFGVFVRDSKYFYAETMGAFDLITVPSPAVKELEQCVPKNLSDRYEVYVFSAFSNDPYSSVLASKRLRNDFINQVRTGILLHPQEEIRLLCQ